MYSLRICRPICMYRAYMYVCIIHLCIGPTCMYVCIYVCRYVYVYVCRPMYVGPYVCRPMYVCMYVYMYVCMYVCVCIAIIHLQYCTYSFRNSYCSRPTTGILLNCTTCRL